MLCLPIYLVVAIELFIHSLAPPPFPSPPLVLPDVVVVVDTYLQNKFYLYFSYMLDFVLLMLKVCRF